MDYVQIRVLLNHGRGKERGCSVEKLILSIILCFNFAMNVYAQEKCDYNFMGGLPALYKEVGFMPDGTKIIDMYIVDNNNNLLNGNVCVYNGSNLIMKVHAENGKQEGVGKSWYKNMNLKWESTYIKGVLNGLSKYYLESGELDKIFIYVNGKAISAECSNGYIWTDIEVSKWNADNKERDSVRNICK